MKIENIVFSISGSFFILVGLAAAYFGHRNVKLAEQSIGWGSVMGKIITSDVVAIQFDNAENPLHRAVVNYTYSVYEKMFYGILVSMYVLDSDKHHLPHIHVRYNEFKASIAIPSGDVLEGNLPIRQMKLVQAWIELHQDDLMADWFLASNGETPFKIDPLR